MALPQPASPQAKAEPEGRPLQFDADISDGPKAGESANHLSGSASGYRASYSDLHSFAWWVPVGGVMPGDVVAGPPDAPPDDAPSEPGEEPAEPPVVPGSSATLIGRPDYADDYRDGTAMSATALARHNGILTFFANGLYYGGSSAMPFVTGSGRISLGQRKDERLSRATVVLSGIE